MIAKIKEFIATINQIIEIVNAINAAKKEVGKEIVEECEKLKIAISSSPNEVDDKLIPVLDLVIKFCK